MAYWDQVQPDPDFGIDYIANVTQYADGLEIDFTIWSVALFQQIVAAPVLLADLDAGYMVLLDKDHLTATLRAPTASAYVPARSTATEFQIWTTISGAIRRMWPNVSGAMSCCRPSGAWMRI